MILQYILCHVSTHFPMPLSNHQSTFFLGAFSGKLQTSVCLSVNISVSLPLSSELCLFTAIFFGYKLYIKWNILIFFFPVMLHFNWRIIDLQCCVQFSSVTQSWLTLCDPVNRSMPGLPVHHRLPEFTKTQVHWVGDAIQPSHPLLSPSPPALNLSQDQGISQWVSSSHQVAKALEFQLYISPSKEHPGLIFTMDWLDLLAVQGTLKSLLQHHS